MRTVWAYVPLVVGTFGGAIGAGGCYRDHGLVACEVSCGTNGACPSDTTCVAGTCAPSGDLHACDTVVDARVADDASDGIDARLPVEVCLTNPYVAGVCAQMAGDTLAVGPMQTLDTDNNGCQVIVVAGGLSACVIAHASIVFQGGSLRVTGSHPLILIANTIELVGGVIDVSSKMLRGAGSVSTCRGGNADDSVANISGGGAGGGGFITAGGSGGNAGGASTPGIGGSAVVPSVLRGGCDGGATIEAPGGFGAGAVYLYGSTSIVLTDSYIDAIGGPGTGGNEGQHGGSAGGSGGMIVFDSPSITLDHSIVLAVGGGGGGGGGGSPPLSHMGSPGMDQTGGAGGDNALPDGRGGNGSSIKTNPGETGVAGKQGTMAGGGGGGGGAGLLGFYDGVTTAIPTVVNGSTIAP